jgi:hypothetical protein
VTGRMATARREPRTRRQADVGRRRPAYDTQRGNTGQTPVRLGAGCRPEGTCGQPLVRVQGRCYGPRSRTNRGVAPRGRLTPDEDLDGPRMAGDFPSATRSPATCTGCGRRCGRTRG